MKCLLLYSLLFLAQPAFSQSDFTLDYKLVGLGSNRYKVFYPEIKVEGKYMAYVVKHLKHKVALRQSSLDSIADIVSVIKDTAIFQSNPCIMSGVLYSIAIQTKEKRLQLTLINTIDSTALKIINILNTYLPASGKILASSKLIKREADCRESIRKLVGHSTRD